MMTDEQDFKSAFDSDSTERYSRHLLMPEIGVEGQQALIDTRILIVGMGGLGSPCALYLAAAGVGYLGLVDYDSVETSNLHRQIIHSEDSVGLQKVESARQSIRRLNSRCQVECFPVQLNESNIFSIMQEYDFVVDGCDNPPTRYLLNDACVLLGKPLVSASAIKMEGQLTVYNYGSTGPCYRCLYPQPPPPGSVSNCEEGGVIGCVVGVLGSLQAMECVKLAIALKQPDCKFDIMSQKLLIYHAMRNSFKVVKLRAKKPDCVSCGQSGRMSELLPSYEDWCGMLACDKSPSERVLDIHDRITVEAYAQHRKSDYPHVLLDVRKKIQFDICSLSRSVHIPLEELSSPDNIDSIRQCLSDADGNQKEALVICRRGNRSQHAVNILKDHGMAARDIIGGLTAWNKQVDPTFPMY